MITRRAAALLAAASLCTGGAFAADDPPRPNIIVFFIDDLGWADLGCYGSAFHETPNIDSLAARGVRFTDAYSANPVCSPTRAALMTGKHPSRLGITDWIGASQKRNVLITPKNVEHLPAAEVTFAEALQDNGYQTAYFGKWHLGKDDADLPTEHGFEFTRGVNRGGAPGSYHPPFRRKKSLPGKPAIHDVPDFEDAGPETYLTDLLAAEATEFVGRAAAKPEPFLLVLGHYSVHTPIQPRAIDQKKYVAKRDAMGLSEKPETAEERYGVTRMTQNEPGLAGMVESVDRSIGQVLAKVKTLGIEDNTLVVFTSDNGGLSTLSSRHGPGCNSPLRAGKGWLYEGGVRVPMIVAGAGVAAAGSTSAEPVYTCDIYPTLLAAAHLPLAPEQHRDGLDLSPLLAGGAPGTLGRDAIYWHFPHYHGSGNRPSAMVRKGGFKLVRWFESGDEQLFEIGANHTEKTDLAGDQPAKRKELAADLDRWMADVGAKLPQPNPDRQ